MFCTKCGKQLPETSNFCPQCGAVCNPTCEDNVETKTNNTTRQKPNNHLIMAIVSTLLFFWPFGVVSIVYASKVDTKIKEGNYEEAEEASGKARSWWLASLITAVVGWVIAIIILVLYFSALVYFLDGI